MPRPSTPSLLDPGTPTAEPLSAAEITARIRLIRTERIGPVTYHELLDHFGSAEAALDALPALTSRSGRQPLRPISCEAARVELATADKIGAQCVFSGAAGYPGPLAAASIPPPLLYLKGDSELLARPMVAIVGSRLASAAGHTLARRFASALGRAGYPIVSGLARGIDRAAHDAALETGTIAVLAGGLDVVYPPEHSDLQAAIAQRGCLVTEQPPGFAPRGQDFPRRNRIISGLSLGVVIVEAARRSGSLVTARFAAEQGREVFAVPGHPLDPRAEGTNALLKAGATLVTDADDVIAALAPLRSQLGAWPEPRAQSVAVAPRGPHVEPAGTDRDRVLNCLVGPAPSTLDQVLECTGLDARTLQVILIELALAGRIERPGHQLVSLLLEAP